MLLVELAPEEIERRMEEIMDERFQRDRAREVYVLLILFLILVLVLSPRDFECAANVTCHNLSCDI